MGKVILVGAGPGDPDLITIKGIKALSDADVIVYDYLANGKLLDYCKPDAEKIYVGKKSGKHTLSQEEINQLLVEKSRGKKVVVRLKGGDPLIFGRGGEEILALAQEGIDFEVIPGVTAGTAALTYAGIPATHRGVATSVSFITGHEDPKKEHSGINWNALANMEGTLVFYMGVRNLPLIVQNLMEQGKSPKTPVALIRWGTLPTQQTLTGSLVDIVKKAEDAAFKPPALIIVGDVVGYRERMNWFESKPLFGKRIVITRARAQSSRLMQELSNLGAQVIQFPTIRIEPPLSWQPLDRAIASLKKYQWIIFTSVNGVEHFMRRLAKQGYDLRKMNGTKVASIGPATTECLQSFGLKADIQPEKFVAESLLTALKQKAEISGKRFLLPRAEIARSLLKDEIMKEGGIVEEIVAYRTVVETDHRENIVQLLKEEQIDLVTFTSSSTVLNFIKLIGQDHLDLLNKCTIAAIGPITRATLNDHGVNVKIMPEDYTIPGLVQSIVNYYNIKK